MSISGDFANIYLFLAAFTRHFYSPFLKNERVPVLQLPYCLFMPISFRFQSIKVKIQYSFRNKFGCFWFSSKTEKKIIHEELVFARKPSEQLRLPSIIELQNFKVNKRRNSYIGLVVNFAVEGNEN